MANIYTIAAAATPFAPNRSMIGIFNGVGSGRVVRVYRIVALNNQTVAVTGVNTILELQKISTGSGGLFLTPAKHDSSSPPIPGQIVTATNMSYTNSGLLRKFFWSNDEPGQGTVGTCDEWQLLPRLSMVWESSYKDANTTPIVLREGQGISLNNTTNTIVGIADFFIEFTVESV
jgi:hypothetical protein